jgi:MFS family permease
MIAMFRSLSVRNYRIYAAGSLFSNIGTWMQRVAQDWLVLTLTGSGATLGLVTGLQFLPALVLSPIAGVVADRWPKRRILQCTQIAMAVPSLALGTLAVTGAVQTWHVLVLACVFGVATTFDGPARQSFAAELVDRPDVANAIGLNSASMHATRLVGPAAAGLMIAWLGNGAAATGWVILLNAASYVTTMTALALMDADTLRSPPSTGRRPRAVRDGFSYVTERPDLTFLMLCALVVGAFGQGFQMLLALMVTDEFGRGAAAYGLVSTCTAIGSLAGALGVARTARPRLGLVAAAGMAFGLLEIAAGLMPTYATFAATLPLLGLSVMTMVTTANVSIQLTSAPEMRGRVAASFFMVLMGGAPLGAPALGWFAEHTSARSSMVLAGSLTCLVVLAASLLYTRQRSRPSQDRVNRAR